MLKATSRDAGFANGPKVWLGSRGGTEWAKKRGGLGLHRLKRNSNIMRMLNMGDLNGLKCKRQ